MPANASRARVTAMGTYVPEKTLTNHDFEKMVETSDEWIVQRTGIRQRRIAKKDEFTSDLAVKAVEDLVNRYSVSVEDVDFIIVATATPDMTFPSVASQVQNRLSIKRAGAIDISAACAGFVYALQLADSLVTSGINRKVLVVGAETLSRVVDFTDRTTCILFGDGAGAFLIENDPEEPSFIAHSHGSDGDAGVHLYLSALSDEIGGKEVLTEGKIVQNGREVFKKAVSTLVEEVPHLLNQAKFPISKLDWFVPHSANYRILEAVSKRLELPMEKVLFSAENYGNTSSASIPLAIDLALREEKLKKGDTLLLSGFGGGFVYASTLMRWSC